MNRNYKEEEFLSMNGIEAKLFSIVNQVTQQFNNPEKFTSIKNLIDDRRKSSENFEKLLNACGATSVQDKKYSGLYVFSELNNGKRQFLYTGISRNLIQRIKQHVMAGDKYTATWAFAMLKNNKDSDLYAVLNKKNKESIENYGFKNKKDLNVEICKEIAIIQKKNIFHCDITFIPITDNFLLHIAEVFVACELNCYWNSFETH